MNPKLLHAAELILEGQQGRTLTPEDFRLIHEAHMFELEHLRDMVWRLCEQLRALGALDLNDFEIERLVTRPPPYSPELDS
jgi:hypothetical protein